MPSGQFAGEGPTEESKGRSLDPSLRIHKRSLVRMEAVSVGSAVSLILPSLRQDSIHQYKQLLDLRWEFSGRLDLINALVL